MTETKYLCESCANYRSPLCELCARVHSPSGRERRPSFYVPRGEIAGSAFRDLCTLVKSGNDALAGTSKTLLELITKSEPLPTVLVLEYNSMIEKRNAASAADEAQCE